MEFIDFQKINVFDSKMVLRAFWESLGLLLGALGGLLGALLDLQIDPKGVTRFGSFRFGALFGLFLSLLLASSCSIFFEVVVSLLLGPLRVDFELPR